MTFPFKAPPMGHQLVALRKAWSKREFSLFHEMGTGKTFTTINLAAARYRAGQIDGLIIICDTPIKNVWYTGDGTWIDSEGNLQGSEIEKWCPVDYSCWVFESGDHPHKWMREKREELKILVLGVESLSIKNGQSIQAAEYFQRFHRFMCVVDESTSIKNWKAARSANVVKIGGWADYRLLLTGTPITQGLEDLFGQFLFLNQKIIGCKNFFVFRNKYCVMGGFQGKQILGYQFTEHLLNQIEPYVDYVTKEECMDLPEQIYPEPIIVEPTVEQKRVIKQLKDQYAAEDQGKQITISTVLERTLRFQQVIGGTFPFEEAGEYNTTPISGKNPKLEAMMQYISHIPADAKVIIWARFVPEIRYIVEALQAEYGRESVVTFYGADDNEQRNKNNRRFREDPACRFIVSNQTVGSKGQTWTAATYNIYYSNTFSYQDRYQSEARSHRKGQHHNVVYQDIEMNIQYDKMILKAVRRKRDLAQEVQEYLTAEGTDT
jgi:SNF2 family DNA or RNA helicase